jgi:hypothetical protein
LDCNLFRSAHTDCRYIDHRDSGVRRQLSSGFVFKARTFLAMRGESEQIPKTLTWTVAGDTFDVIRPVEPAERFQYIHL